MYRALYRKWRPKVFADVVGQEATVAAFKSQIITGRVGHAYLFTGTRGTGKTSCAKIFAQAVNCENPNEAEPCGECVPCVGIENGSILDVVEIDAASNNSVDDIRDLRDETAYRPSRCKYKVYIIDEVHMLSISAFNALLKIMEEPPSHVIFILATTEIHKVPATILSRCQRFDFVRISTEKMAERLTYVALKEEIDLTQEAANLIARLADGALRDALSLLDTCAGLGQRVDETLVRRMAGVSDKDYLFKLSDAIAGNDTQELLSLVAHLRQQAIDVKRLTEELISHYRNFMLASAAPDGSLLNDITETDVKKIVQKSKEVKQSFAIAAVRRFADALDKMGRSPDPRIELELALFDLSQKQEGSLHLSQNNLVMDKFSPNDKVAPKQVEHKEKLGKITSEENAEQNKEIPVEKETEKNFDNSASDISPLHDGISGLEQWGEIIDEMSGINKMLHSYMKNSKAFLDGKRVLIDGGDMFLTFMRSDEKAANQIKDAVEKVTGQRYGIGPYTQKEPLKAVATAHGTLKEWEKKGVPVNYE